MKLKSIMAISASILLVGANLFVISAKQGSVNCKSLLSKTLSFNHFAFANMDAGSYGFTRPCGNVEAGDITNCNALKAESYDVNVSIKSDKGQKMSKYINGETHVSAEAGPYLSADLAVRAGNSADGSSNDEENIRIVGTININAKTARPRYIYCDYHNYIPCTEHVDPCNELMSKYRAEAFSLFGI